MYSYSARVDFRSCEIGASCRIIEKYCIFGVKESSGNYYIDALITIDLLLCQSEPKIIQRRSSKDLPIGIKVDTVVIKTIGINVGTVDR